MSRECSHYTKRAGLVTNVDPATWPEGVHAAAAFESRSTCGRTECIEDAIRRVAGSTNATATFYPDPQKKRATA